MDRAENVLVIMSDEHQRRAMGCAGHPVVQTPNLDALAATGTRFTQAWTPSPICVPARAAFVTGRWVHAIGAWDSVQAYAGSPPGWTHALRDAGRDVVSFGKLHHRSAADDDGFSERVLPMFIVDERGWLQGLPRRDPLPYPEAAELAALTGEGETSYSRYDRRIAAEAASWLRHRAGSSRPWVAFVSFVTPHYPFRAPVEFSDLYPLSDIPPPEIGAVEHRHPAVAAMQRFFAYGDHFDRDTVRRARRAYFALCSFVDHQIGMVLDALDAGGHRDSTRVIYTSDHGELLGNRGLWAKSFLFEDSVGIPLIVSGPGVPAGVERAGNVNLVDVAPTVLETAGLPSPGPGRSLWQSAHAADDSRVGFSEYHDGGSITGSFAVRVGDWKYVHHEGYRPELYDLGADGDELVDRAGDRSSAARRAECEEALRSIVDPAVANEAAFASQEALIRRHGGRDGVARAFRFNHTPAPG